MKLEDVGFVMNDKGIMELVDYELLIEKFIEKNKLIMLKNNKGKYSYYMYDEYYWKLTDEVEIIREMVNFLSNIEPKTWKYKYSNPVIHFLQLALKIEDKMDKYKHIMEFKDFAVNLRNGYVEEKDVERYNTYYKKYTVEELDNSTCPVFESFLKDITGGNEEFEEYLILMIGSILSSENRRHKIRIIHGAGGEGKSVFLGLINHLVGDRSASRKLDTFSQTFGLQGLSNKIFVHCSESESTKPVKAEVLKGITGSDEVEIQEKFLETRTEKLDLNILFLCNNLFKIHDDSDGIKRRLELIPFHNPDSKKKRDPYLLEKLKREEVGILNKVIGAYQGLLIKEEENNGMDMMNIPKVVKEFTAMYIEKYLVPKGSYGTSDEELCLNYLEIYWITDEKERVDKMIFYKFFKKMTNNNMSNISFWRYLKTSLNKIGIIERKDGKAFIEGIKINPEYEEELNQFINNNNVEEKE
mgnify:FL=1